MCAGRLWQSMQSMRCRGALAIWSLFNFESWAKVLGHPPLHILHVNVRNDLSLLIGCYELNLIGDIHVPVDSFRSSCRRIAAARFNQHANLTRSILFVAGIVGEDLELRSVKFSGPVALFAGVLRRTQVVYWRRRRARVGVEGHCIYLMCARQLGLHKP